MYLTHGKQGFFSGSGRTGLVLVAIMLPMLLGGPASALAGGDGYNTVTVYNCTKGDGVVSEEGSEDLGVHYLSFQSYNSWDDDMTFAFSALGQNGNVQNVDPGQSATLNCLQKKFILDSTSYNECKIVASKIGFPDTEATLADGGTYYLTGLTTDSEGSFSATKPSFCE